MDMDVESSRSKRAKMAFAANRDAASFTKTAPESKYLTSDALIKVPAVSKPRKSVWFAENLFEIAGDLNWDNRNDANEPHCSVNFDTDNDFIEMIPLSCSDLIELPCHEEGTKATVMPPEPIEQKAIPNSTGVTQPFYKDFMIKSAISLAGQQNDNQQLIDDLRKENIALKADLRKYKELYFSAIEKTTSGADAGNALQSKLNALYGDLKNAQAKTIEANVLVSRMNTTAIQNANSNTSNSDLQPENIGNKFQYAESTTEESKQFKAAIQSLSSENTRLANQVTGLEEKINLVKEQTRKQYEKMLQDVKQKRWCATCFKSTGPYYCSAQCEFNHDRKPW